MTFYERLSEVCREIKTTPTTIAKDLGIATSAPVKWKSGTIPNGETLAKIADHVNVSVDYLLGRSEDKKIRPTENNDESDLSKAMEEAFILLKGMSESERQIAVRVLRGLKDSEDN